MMREKGFEQCSLSVLRPAQRSGTGRAGYQANDGRHARRTPVGALVKRRSRVLRRRTRQAALGKSRVLDGQLGFTDDGDGELAVRAYAVLKSQGHRKLPVGMAGIPLFAQGGKAGIKKINSQKAARAAQKPAQNAVQKRWDFFCKKKNNEFCAKKRFF